MNLPAIETRELSRTFGATTAVAGVTLSVARGEMFGLVGPDGAGKSTLIRLLCGLLKPSGGLGSVLGYNLDTGSEQIKSRIGYLSQNFTLYGDLSVDENIEFFAEIHGVRSFAARRDELLAFTRLAPFRGRLAAALSGGMKKKLALACALIHRPEILFLDEPSTGVDPLSRGEFWNILSGILSGGITIFMTTPYLDEAERCHRIGLMHKGVLVRIGSPQDIEQSLAGQVFELQSGNPAEAHGILKLKWPPSALVRYGTRLHLHARGGRVEADEAASWLAQNGMAGARLAETAPSLEDVFVAEMREKDKEDSSHETVRSIS